MAERERESGDIYRQDINSDFIPNDRTGKMINRRPLRRKSCGLCRDKIDLIDYKDVHMLRSFIPERGKIMPRRISGNCAIHQRMLATAIKRARSVAFIPFVAD
jgi:small subunit ribosomal protein S18